MADQICGICKKPRADHVFGISGVPGCWNNSGSTTFEPAAQPEAAPMYSSFDAKEQSVLYQPQDNRSFGTHVSEAVAIVKDWVKPEAAPAQVAGEPKRKKGMNAVCGKCGDEITLYKGNYAQGESAGWHHAEGTGAHDHPATLQPATPAAPQIPTKVQSIIGRLVMDGQSWMADEVKRLWAALAAETQERLMERANYQAARNREKALETQLAAERERTLDACLTVVERLKNTLPDGYVWVAAMDRVNDGIRALVRPTESRTEEVKP